MKVCLEEITKKWGQVAAVDGLSLEVEHGEFVALLGPSGCGKTTTLLLIAGIYSPTSGIIRFDGRVANHLAPKDRNIGMVFQSYALYPHMTVFQNIAYPLKLKRLARAEIRHRVEQTAERVGIGDLLKRKPAELSGGQQQRVALCRALVKRPSLLLFDEPLSNLDARLRIAMRREIRRLQAEFGITAIYVTHDQVEAMTMADRIAVMQGGRLEGYDTPARLYERPATRFIAEFLGHPPMVFAEVRVEAAEGRYYATAPGFRLLLPTQLGQRAAGDDNVIMGIRPEHVSVGHYGLEATVLAVEPLGREHLVHAAVGSVTLSLLAAPSLGLRPDDQVRLVLQTDQLHFFDPRTQRSLLAADMPGS